jgi:transposase
LRPSQRAELVADYAAGMPVRAISKKYGVHRATIPKLVRRVGISVRTSGLSIEQHAEAASLYESGMTLMEVGSRLGVSQQSVRRALTTEGVKVRPPGRRGRVTTD